MKKILVILLLCCSMSASKADQLEDFIRGTWVTFAGVNIDEFHCVPGMVHYDSSEINIL